MSVYTHECKYVCLYVCKQVIMHVYIHVFMYSDFYPSLFFSFFLENTTEVRSGRMLHWKGKMTQCNLKLTFLNHTFDDVRTSMSPLYRPVRCNEKFSRSHFYIRHIVRQVVGIKVGRGLGLTFPGNFYINSSLLKENKKKKKKTKKKRCKIREDFYINPPFTSLTHVYIQRICRTF